MYVPSHLAFGYLLARGAEVTVVKRPLRTWETLTIMAASVAPDIDGLLADSVAGHHMATHTPLFWLALAASLALVGRISGRRLAGLLAGLILAGALGHLFTDWATARTVGIQWLWPFSPRDFFLYPIQPGEGQMGITGMLGGKYLSFYAENRLLLVLEVLCNLLALGLFWRRWRKPASEPQAPGG